GRSIEADLCSGQTTGLTDWPIERIAQTVEPNDAQRAVLDELKDATAQAFDILKAACPTALPSTPTGRIAAMRQRLEAMLQAVRTVRPAVEKFYQSLNDEQKARFNTRARQPRSTASAARFDASLRRARIGHRELAVGADRTRRATRWGAAQRPQGIAGRHVGSGQSVELGLPHLSGAHAGRPSAGDGATARRDAARGANRAARARKVLWLARRRAKGTVQPARPHSELTPRNRRPRRKIPFVPANAGIAEHQSPLRWLRQFEGWLTPSIQNVLSWKNLSLDFVELFRRSYKPVLAVCKFRSRGLRTHCGSVPPHSITSSARASSFGGTSRPSAFAVLRLMASSNFAACSIGRSAGFAPARILAT